MPLRKDESGRRWVELEVQVPGTPEQVWQAIATGPGMSAWFTTTSVEERVGGAISFDFGDESCGEDVSSGKVTAWEPARWGNRPAPWRVSTSTARRSHGCARASTRMDSLAAWLTRRGECRDLA